MRLSHSAVLLESILTFIRSQVAISCRMIQVSCYIFPHRSRRQLPVRIASNNESCPVLAHERLCIVGVRKLFPRESEAGPRPNMGDECVISKTS